MWNVHFFSSLSGLTAFQSANCVFIIGIRKSRETDLLVAWRPVCKCKSVNQSMLPPPPLFFFFFLAFNHLKRWDIFPRHSFSFNKGLCVLSAVPAGSRWDKGSPVQSAPVPWCLFLITGVSKNKGRKKKKPSLISSYWVSIWQLVSFPFKSAECWAAEQRERTCDTYASSDRVTLWLPCACFSFFFFTLKWIQDMDGFTRQRSNVIFNVMALHGELIHEKKAFEKPRMKQRHTRGLFFFRTETDHLLKANYRDFICRKKCTWDTIS